VMLTDREAEHIPGCNMVFYKWALEQIGRFDPVFRKAGDDVDVCWRLQETGHKIGFSPAGFVWHYRRSTVRAYFRQQAGYGEAEALLVHKHPEYFNALGGGVWRGRIYSAGMSGLLVQRPVIYHGIFGSAFFQKIYARNPSFAAMVCTSLQYHVFVTVPLVVLSLWFPSLLSAALAALLASAGVCVAAAAQAVLPADRERWWSRPLIALLFFSQPIVRGIARLRAGTAEPRQAGSDALLPSLRSLLSMPNLRDAVGGRLSYWCKSGASRYAFIHSIQEGLVANGWAFRTDSGWDPFDFECATNQWARARLITAHEELSGGRMFFRCRIETRASALSWLLAAAVLLACGGVIAAYRESEPLIWFVAAALPFAGLFVWHQQEWQRKQIATVIGNVATMMRFEEFESADDDNSTEPVLSRAPAAA